LNKCAGLIRVYEITRTEKEIVKIKERITNLQDQFMDGNISSNDFHPMKERTEKTLTAPIIIGINSN